MADRKRKLPSWITDSTEEQESGNDNATALSAEISPILGRSQDVVGEEAGEDDYLNMTFDTPSNNSSLIGRRERKLLERREGGRHRPDSALDKSAASRSTATRDASQPPSKALKMMQKMGYSSGQALGPDSRGIIEPLIATEHNDRGGLGLANQQRREIKQKNESSAKLVQEEQTEFRQTVRSEIDEKRLEGRIHAAQKICETLDTKAFEEMAIGRGEDLPSTVNPSEPKDVNVLWRSLVVYRKERERERSLRQQMLDSSMSFSGRQYNEDGPDPSRASTVADLRRTVYEEDGEDEEDPELREFEDLDAAVRLSRILEYLRTTYFYCFWCGCQYADREDLGNCPGLDEEDHE